MEVNILYFFNFCLHSFPFFLSLSFISLSFSLYSLSLALSLSSLCPISSQGWKQRSEGTRFKESKEVAACLTSQKILFYLTIKINYWTSSLGNRVQLVCSSLFSQNGNAFIILNHSWLREVVGPLEVASDWSVISWHIKYMYFLPTEIACGRELFRASSFSL